MQYLKTKYIPSCAVSFTCIVVFNFAIAADSATLPLTSSTLFSSSGNCAVCHAQLQDDGGNDVSIDAHWRSSMMANSLRDPFFQAKVSSELARFPELEDVIYQKCATCHAPMARTQALADDKEIALFDDGFLNPQNELHTLAIDGISCTVCHQIQDLHLGEHESFSGGYTIDFLARDPERLIFGPYENPVTQNMRNMVGFTPTHSAHIGKSELCATCHTLYTPYLDENGVIAGEFPEQTVYLEWEHSDFGTGKTSEKSCQQCHMPQADGSVQVSTLPRNLAKRQPFFQHHFVGGNTFVLSLLNQYGDELSTTSDANHFDATYGRAYDQLQNTTAQIDLLGAEIANGALNARFAVRPQTGHKFPSGFPSRRAWIHFTAFDGNGDAVFESGRPMEDGSIAGNDADADLALYEPHYDVISQSDRVQIYEAIMLDTQDRVTYTLLSAAKYAKDNRLTPEGFDKANADPDIAVFGQAADDDDFIGGKDEIEYAISLEGFNGPFSIQAELLYQTVGYSFIADLEEETTDQITRMARYYHNADKTPVLIGSVQQEGLVKETNVRDWMILGEI